MITRRSILKSIAAVPLIGTAAKSASDQLGNMRPRADTVVPLGDDGSHKFDLQKPRDEIVKSVLDASPIRAVGRVTSNG